MVPRSLFMGSTAEEKSNNRDFKVVHLRLESSSRFTLLSGKKAKKSVKMLFSHLFNRAEGRLQLFDVDRVCLRVKREQAVVGRADDLEAGQPCLISIKQEQCNVGGRHEGAESEV